MAKYTKLDSDNLVTEVLEYTQEEFDALSIIDQADLYLCTYEDVAPGWVYLSKGVFHSQDEEHDIQFANDRDSYIEPLCDEIDAMLEERFESGYMYNGKPYKADIKSQLWANAYLQAIQNGTMTGVINWISIDNTVTQFTITEYADMCAYFLNWAQMVTFEHFQAKGMMRASATRAEVDAIHASIAAKVGVPDPQS